MDNDNSKTSSVISPNNTSEALPIETIVSPVISSSTASITAPDTEQSIYKEAEDFVAYGQKKVKFIKYILHKN